MAEEDVEIQIGIEKAKARLGDLKDELERLKRENGEITIGAASGSAGSGRSGASGQTGAELAMGGDPETAGLAAAYAAMQKAAEAAVGQFFPQITQLLKDGFAASAVAGRVSPIAEQYARLTGQQLPQEVINRLAQQAVGPEVAASRARGLSGAAADRAAGLNAIEAASGSAWDDLQRLYQRFFAASPPSPRGLGGGG